MTTNASFKPSKNVLLASAGGIFVLILALWLLFSGGNSGTVDMAGKVTSKGRAIVFGTVTAIASDGNIYSAPIKPDGSYELKGLPPGPVKLAVTSPNPRPKLGAASSTNNSTAKTPATASRPGSDPLKTDPRDPTRRKAVAAESQTAPPPPVAGPEDLPQQGNWFPINGRYADPNTSGIRGSAGSGDGNIRLD